MTTIMASSVPWAAFALDAIPPEAWIALASTALTLLVSAAHARGKRLPLVEWLLDVVQAAPAPSPAAAAPTRSEDQSGLRELLAELKALRETRQNRDKGG